MYVLYKTITEQWGHFFSRRSNQSAEILQNIKPFDIRSEIRVIKYSIINFFALRPRYGLLRNDYSTEASKFQKVGGVYPTSNLCTSPAALVISLWVSSTTITQRSTQKPSLHCLASTKGIQPYCHAHTSHTPTHTSTHTHTHTHNTHHTHHTLQCVKVTAGV